MRNDHRVSHEKPRIEQVCEFRNTTRRDTEPVAPQAAQFGKGASNVNEIAEAAAARRQQSNSWPCSSATLEAVACGNPRCSPFLA